MKLQHFSCFAGAAAAAEAELLTLQWRDVDRAGAGGRSRGKDRLGGKPGGGMW